MNGRPNMFPTITSKNISISKIQVKVNQKRHKCRNLKGKGEKGKPVAN